MNSRLILAVFLAAASTSLFAQWYDAQTGKASEEEPWRKQKGDLGAMLALTAHPDAFLKEWEESEFAHAPSLKSVNSVRRGEVIAAFVLFSGCSSDRNHCDAVIDFKVLRPDGTTYAEQGGLEAWRFPVQVKNAVQLSQPQLRIRIEPKDPFGKYTVQAVFKRPSSGDSLELEETFEVQAD